MFDMGFYKMENSTDKNQIVKLPLNIKGFYSWLYDSDKMSEFFDKQYVNDILTLGACRQLSYELAREIPMNANVIQFGITFGNQIDLIARKITSYGKYLVIDNNAKQIKRCENKFYGLYPQLKFEKADASRFKSDTKFDRVICYNLLHELPPLSKIKVVDSALNLVGPKGKVIFIDYHNPSKWNPLRYFIRMFNRLFQPFAEKLWERGIDMYATKSSDFSWRKNTYWGGMYQKTIATRKSKPF